MTIEQFSSLTEMEKVAAILQSGKLIAQQPDNERKIFHYRMGSFYACTTYGAHDDALLAISIYTEAAPDLPTFRKQLNNTHPAERAYNTPEV